jgi:hypothetical protein
MVERRRPRQFTNYAVLSFDQTRVNSQIHKYILIAHSFYPRKAVQLPKHHTVLVYLS